MNACTECERPSRGPVPEDGVVAAHVCRQCGEHCELRAHMVRLLVAERFGVAV